MRILDRYILFSVFKIFFATILIFSLLYVMIDITSNVDDLIDRKVPLKLLGLYYLSFLPIILVQTSSIACLVSILLAFSSLNSSNEIIVMRSSGMNFWQLTKPALFFGLIIAILTFWVSERLVPKASEVTQKIKNEKLVNKKKAAYKKRERIRNLTFYGLKNRLYFVDSYNPHDDTLKGITIIEYDTNQNIKQKIVALEGKWTGIAWKFYNCQISTFDRKTNKAPVKFYKEKLMDIKETPDDLLAQRLSVSTMNLVQLKDYIGRFSSSGATKALNNLRVDLHSKVSAPFGNFVIVLIGLPFSIIVRSRKRSSFAAIGVALAIGFLYYVLSAVTIAFGKGGLFPPIVAAWAAPLITMLIALIVIKQKF